MNSSDIEEIIRDALPTRFQNCSVRDGGKGACSSVTVVTLSAALQASVVWGRIQSVLQLVGVRAEQESGPEPRRGDKTLNVSAKVVRDGVACCRICVRMDLQNRMTIAVIDLPIETPQPAIMPIVPFDEPPNVV